MNLTNIDKLNMLIEQGMFEPVELDEKNIIDENGRGDFRIIYLMNDTVESFLVFKNAKYTGEYNDKFEGFTDIELEKREEGYVLIIKQEQSYFLIFFDDVELENYYYNYGKIGHFWIKGYEHLRVLEYQVAIVWDKMCYIGKESCTDNELKIASLKQFPPLNYCNYPCVPDIYQVPLEDKWHLSKDANNFMMEIAKKAGDTELEEKLLQYGENPTIKNAKKMAKLFRRKEHKKVIQLLMKYIEEAAAVYPDRSFGKSLDERNKKLLDKAVKRKNELEKAGMEAVVYKEEQFVYDCDSVEFNVYVMLWKDGLVNSSVRIEKIE